eukprot:471836-Rhodomonas_salina.1
MVSGRVVAMTTSSSLPSTLYDHSHSSPTSTLRSCPADAQPRLSMCCACSHLRVFHASYCLGICDAYSTALVCYA